jgi:hypothetical protein
VVAATLAAAAPRVAAQSPAPGYALDEIPSAPGGAYVGGFELLPNGNYAVFDGAAVVEISPADGSVIATIFTPPAPVFGAFLTISPDGGTLYFGESTDGHVWEIDLASGSAGWAIDTVYPFDLAFDPQGRAFLSYALGFFQGSYVALCDFGSGALDDVVSSPEASGPVAFDADGNLLTATPDFSSWPPPPDATEVLRFAADDVESAIGPTVLDVSAGTVIGLVVGADALALDEAGDVLVSDSNYGVIVDLDAGTGVESVLAEAGLYNSFLYLRHARGTKGAFEPWQPSEAGDLLAIRSDFFSFNGLTRVHPARPELSTTPGSPIPPGPFDFHVTGGVPDGFGLMLITGGAAADETALKNRTWPAPLYVGLDFTGR